MGDDIRQARIDLAAVFRWSARLGFNEGICNHYSCVVGSNHFLINPQGFHWSELKASHLLLVDLKGNVVEGQGKVEPTAFFIHLRTHLGLPQARCILHTHMPYATAIAATEVGRLEIASQNSLRFHGRIAYEDEYNGLALEAAEGDQICRALGDKHILFLANHGVIVVAKSIARAFDDLYYLERACQVQWLVQSTGRKLKLVDDQIARRTAAQFEKESDQVSDHLAAIRRILNREEPNYAD